MSKGKHYYEQQIKHRDGQISDLKKQVKDLKGAVHSANAQVRDSDMEAQEWARKYRAEIHKQKTDKKAAKA